jgi:hypothetical protein
VRRIRRAAAPVLACAGLVLVLAAPAGAMTAHSWGFACSGQYGWVRANWPTIRTDSAALQAVYFRVRLLQYTRKGWRSYGLSRRYVGVSNDTGRFYLDSSFGFLPYPFVGTYGHLFAYETPHGSYAGPQLGPFWKHLPAASYRTRERYSVRGVAWANDHTVVWQGTARYCTL